MKSNTILKRVIDILMTLALIFLMSFQIAPQKYHEYVGTAMLFLVIVHNFLNYRWYGALLKGKYNVSRIFQTFTTFMLLLSFVITMFSGIVISESFKSLNIPDFISTARIAHLCSSYWSFALMGLHTGFHWGIMAAKMKFNNTLKNILAVLISGYGFYLALRAGIFDYMFLETYFAYFDYDAPIMLVLCENISMLGFFVMIGFNLMRIINLSGAKKFLPAAILLSSIIFGGLLYYFIYLNGGVQNF